MTLLVNHSTGTRAIESYGELQRAMESSGEPLVKHKNITVCLLKCFGELWTAMESYGEPWVNKFIIHLNMTRQGLRRATESYGELGELRIAMF